MSSLHEQQIGRLNELQDEIHTFAGQNAYETAKVRHTLLECAQHLEKLGNEAAEIALDACCPLVMLRAMAVACTAKSGACVFWETPAPGFVWAQRARRFVEMGEIEQGDRRRILNLLRLAEKEN